MADNNSNSNPRSGSQTKPDVRYIIEQVLTPNHGAEQNRPNQVFTLSANDVQTLVQTIRQRQTPINTTIVSEEKYQIDKPEYDRSRLVPMDPYSVVSAEIDGNVLNLSIDMETLLFILMVVSAIIMLYALLKMFMGSGGSYIMF